MTPDPIFRLLTRYPRPIQPVSPIEALGSAGGHSGAALWRYQAERGPLGIRAWPIPGPTVAQVAGIHGWLAEAEGHGFLPIPVPIAGLGGQTVQYQDGRCWEIAPWLPGEPHRKPVPDEACVRAAFAALAKFHCRLARHRRQGSSPGLCHRFRELDDLERRDYDRLQTAVASCTDQDLVAAARQWLALSRIAVPRILPALSDATRLVVSLQPCLRDARPDHFLFEGDRISGLVDFGAMGFETVAADLARLCGEWLAGDRSLRVTALAAYEQVRPLDPSEAALIGPFEDAADVLIAGHWLAWHLLEGRKFPDPLAVGRGVARGLDRLGRLTQRLNPPGTLA
jgi:Ser/Thr protein kinase RdoA (MazF antagonist)